MFTFLTSKKFLGCLLSLNLLSIANFGMAHANNLAGHEALAHKDYHKALQEFEVSAQRGELDGEFHLGLAYYQLPNPNYEKAIYWLERAARHNKVEVYGNLATIYSNPKNPLKNMQRAVECWEKAAFRNNPLASAQYNLALVYLEGKYKPKNIQASFDLLKKAATNGNAQAKYNLGARYFHGTNGALKNTQLARQYFLEAAHSNLTEAQSQIAHFMLQGIGGPKDIKGAIYWLEKLAKGGDEYSQLTLSTLYTGGKDIPINKSQAFKWLTLLTLQSDNFDAKDLLIQLSKTMSDNEKKEALKEIQTEIETTKLK